ncbi:flagellar FliJ protein [Buchnera aphidicola str. Bp (Baizongia pistaciae)]|uniref:Flagellar FliJ protein n=1 Tax=Buchnera aphidicola subsp. Baizongia pistaciae (strain Bp) TaxID=224915 RepID=FLIJ_BUCBP|nr:flagellar FliJ protein [Buchnera aphidicola]Q89AZ6.1 RecName: Full=Flagellar FliJ protein [Buchnera aphidicola str. Bp (Baizongia pistaciae)]AAO26808.1 flagellar FliJ protein [Buchnera aphidicola str. Bp (Baizongia pistaciae)]
MYKKKRCFTLLKYLDVKSNYHIVLNLKKILSGIIQVKAQLDILMSYQCEYLKCLDQELKFYISGTRLAHYYNFIAFLIDGVNKQNDTMCKLYKQYNEYIYLWKKKQKKIKMWNNINSRLLLNRFKLSQLDDQDLLDSCCTYKYLLKNDREDTDYV